MLTRRRHRRSSLVIGVAATVGALTLAVVASSTLDVANAGARAEHESAVASLSPLLAESAGALGTAAGDSALGLQNSYFEPPPTEDNAQPGFTIASGADQPDPFMLEQGDEYYLFTSQDKNHANVPVHEGTVVGRWGPEVDALPYLPAWAVPGIVWAPDVAQFGNHDMLYFTAQLVGVSPQTMCIGDAISAAPSGPYLPATTPLVCQQALGGSIDPRVFVDEDGQPYLLWKSDQNARADQAGLPTVNTQIYSQALSADGLSLTGQPSVIFGPDEAWQNHIVEAPQMVLVRGTYWLFYSGGWFNQADYAIGVARCQGPDGPCADVSPVPFLGSNVQGEGPGEESVFSNAAGVWLLYTPFRSTLPDPGPPRPTAMAHLGFGPDGPYMAEPLVGAHS
jgi:beta-xylosidase